MPRVTIGLPVYNGAALIEQSIRSVLGQTYRDLELVISDNASTDDTLAVIERCTAGDDRVVVLRNDQNQGAAWNYNNVLAHARGEFFRWHAHDDWFEPTLIEELVAALDAEPDAVLAHSWTQFVDDQDQPDRLFQDDLGADGPRPDVRLARTIRRLTFCNAVFGLIRRDVLDRTARIASFPGSDSTLLFELAMFGRFVVVPKPLYLRRPGNSIKSNPSMRQVAAWFDPRSTGARFPGLHQWRESVRATGRASQGPADRIRLLIAFHRVWPLDYARKSRRRRRRRAGRG